MSLTSESLSSLEGPMWSKATCKHVHTQTHPHSHIPVTSKENAGQYVWVLFYFDAALRHNLHKLMDQGIVCVCSGLAHSKLFQEVILIIHIMCWTAHFISFLFILNSFSWNIPNVHMQFVMYLVWWWVVFWFHVLTTIMHSCWQQVTVKDQRWKITV